MIVKRTSERKSRPTLTIHADRFITKNSIQDIGTYFSWRQLVEKSLTSAIDFSRAGLVS